MYKKCTLYMYAQGHLILIYFLIYCKIIQTFYKLVYEFLQKLPVLQRWGSFLFYQKAYLLSNLC
ncbi:hypothetical protein ACS78_01090 [Priestia megaterium]|nr:hypothetical protein ACS78_01090 [Priestia megaterium]